MLGHEHISCDDKFVADADRLKFMLEDAVTVDIGQEWTPAITTECDEMECSALLITNQSFRHWTGFYMWIRPTTLP